MVFERGLGDPFSSPEMWLDHLWAKWSDSTGLGPGCRVLTSKTQPSKARVIAALGFFTVGSSHLQTVFPSVILLKPCVSRQ